MAADDIGGKNVDAAPVVLNYFFSAGIGPDRYKLPAETTSPPLVFTAIFPIVSKPRLSVSLSRTLTSISLSPS
jgi:hypothetical protein